MKGRRVIKIGGSLLFTEKGVLDITKIEKFCQMFKKNNNSDTIVIICGGGMIAREYINAVRSFQENEALCDTIGIELSRVNSKLLIASLKDLAYPIVPKSMEELSIALLFNKIIVMGGLQPGQSTTSVALEVAEFMNADELIILTDVKGIYDKDPKKFDDAKLLKNLTYRELQDIIFDSSKDKQAAAGEYRIFDAVSLQILKRSNIKTVILSGKILNEFEKYWNGEVDITCTIITNEKL
ncbi:MAG: UMP kinase [Candidatus Lokiarchaeia archaeon]|nr:UMP kinase [Candidatus Lokiarchaeia archaeon]